MKTNWQKKTLEPFVDKGWIVKTNCSKKTLKPFIAEGLIVATTLIKVLANSPELLSLNN